jgi:hypothetical protein
MLEKLQKCLRGLPPQIYAPQKIINYASVKKRGRLQRSNEKVRYEEFSTQRTVSKVRPAESRPAGKRAGRDYYFSNREKGQHLMGLCRNCNFRKGHQQKLMAFVLSAGSTK